MDASSILASGINERKTNMKRENNERWKGKELVFSASRKDFRVDTFRSGGKGGQHQNKTDSGVRITHIETKLSAESRSSRSQAENKKIAFRKVCDLLVRHVKANLMVERVTSDEVIRTYHAPDNRVKDHVSGMTDSYDSVVNKDGMDNMIRSRSQEKTVNTIETDRLT